MERVRAGTVSQSWGEVWGSCYIVLAKCDLMTKLSTNTVGSDPLSALPQRASKIGLGLALPGPRTV